MFGLTPYRENRNLEGYNPFRMFDELERGFFRDSAIAEFKTDIREDGDSYILEADLPGFNKEDIKVDIDGGYMTISAQRSSSSEEKDKDGGYVRRERSFGSFARSFDVSGVNSDAISAAYQNGVLTVTMPKKSAELPTAKRLEIQ